MFNYQPNIAVNTLRSSLISFMRISLSSKNKFLIKLQAVLLFIFVLISTCCRAQVLSNSGKDFWLGYGAHASMFNADGTVNKTTGGTQEMRLYLSSFITANITIEMPLTGWRQTITLTTSPVEVIIPKTGPNDARLTAEGIFNTGIHISSDQPITAVCHMYDQGSSASSLLIPVEILGQDYYTLGAKQAAQENNSFSWCFVAATEDSTLLEITPSANTQQHIANVPFTQVLQKGQILNLIGALTGTIGNINTGVDLTGTRIRTLSTGIGPCKKIAVFTGSSNTLISCASSGTADDLFQQVFPYRAWGKMFITVPTVNMDMNLYRVFINNPSTRVTVNGILLTNPVNGKYYEFQTNKVSEIASTLPILVAQYITSEGQCGNTGNGTNGDPEMIYLTPLNYAIASTLVESPQYYAITSNYVNVVLNTVTIDSFFIDKVKMASFFKPCPFNASFSYAQIPLTQGIHFLHIDSLSFTATAYGYGNNESYGYNAGINMGKLSAFAEMNPYSISTVQKICKTVPFTMYIDVKIKPTEMIFDFQKNQFLSPNNIVDLINPVPDSAYLSGFDTFYRYKLPSAYNYAENGSTSFPVNITLFLPTAEGCIEQRNVLYTVATSEKPVAGISVNYNSCSIDTLFLSDSSTVPSGRFINWLWNFGDGTSLANQQNPGKKYTAYGNYKISLRSITDIGCFADTSKIISLNAPPVANFGFSGLYCPFNNIQFTDSSTVLNPWRIAKWQWDFGDGTASTTQDQVKQYNAGGNYNVKLVIYTDKDCVDSIVKPISIFIADTFTQFITIKNPFAVSITQKVCSTEPFNISATFTLRQAQLHWDFLGNAKLTPNNNIDILSPAPDSVYFNGTDSFFRYSLPANYSYSGADSFAVKLTVFTPTKGGCLSQTVFNYTIHVSQKPVADWALNYNPCSNDTLYFKDQSNSFGDTTILWQWSFGDGTIDSVNNPVMKYTDYGDYAVSLHIVTNIGCFADTSKPVSLSPAPVTGFGFSGVLFCPNANIIFTDSSTIQAPWKIVKWQWNFGDGTSSASQNISKQYADSGNYSVQLIAGSDHNCNDTLTKPINIYSIPTINVLTDYYVGEGAPFQITPAYTGTGLTYLWTPPDYLNNDTIAYPLTTPLKDIIYTVTVTGNGGCQAAANIDVHVEKLISVPNAFSPNGDGINDKWMIGNIEGYPNCIVKIFSRSGQLVFSSVGYNKPWDGTLNGKPLPIGTYYYIIDTKQKLFPGKSGYVVILR